MAGGSGNPRRVAAPTTAAAAAFSAADFLPLFLLLEFSTAVGPETSPEPEPEPEPASRVVPEIEPTAPLPPPPPPPAPPPIPIPLPAVLLLFRCVCACGTSTPAWPKVNCARTASSCWLAIIERKCGCPAIFKLAVIDCTSWSSSEKKFSD